MKNHKIILLVLILFFLTKTGIGQDRVTANISRTIDKIKVIQNQYRVVEKTFSDIVISPDTTFNTNQVLSYVFSASNRYHLNLFGASDEFSDINLSIVKFDENDKAQVVAKDDIVSNDIVISFNPTKSGTYYLLVKGKLKDKVDIAYFNLIIDRD